jgi:stage II sporulation protein D
MRRGSSVRQSIATSLVLLVLLFLVPPTLVGPFQPELFSGETPMDETEGDFFAGGERDGQITLRILSGDEVETMDLGTYLVGVVRAEMPASFEPETLKAQAVAARTYTLYQLRQGKKHGSAADLCTVSGCCQAFLTEEQARKNWGDQAEAYAEKVNEAVRATDGQIIVYEGEPILAVFHSSSSGQTRTAGKVWTNDLPYLQSVASPEDGERIPNYYSRVEMSAEAFRTAIRERWPEADLSGKPEIWLTGAARDSGGSVETVQVGGETVRGTELRSALGLRSACFEWEVQDGVLVFFVTGYGHGVGMSQYGANRMAEDGASYQEILTHYYTGVKVEAFALQ